MWQVIKNYTGLNPTSSSSDDTNDPSEVGESPPSSCAVGIDLGTTFSCVAVYQNRITQCIPNQFGDHLTPSVVFYDPKTTEVSVGRYADEWGIQAKTSFIYDVKRLMGRKYDDVYIQALIKNGDYNFKIVRGKDDNAEIEIKHNGKTMTKTPEEVSSEILKYLKDSASKFLGFEVKEAVVSVPAHFSNAQRKATKRAAELAGLKLLKLVCEPVAAAIYYSLNKLTTKTTLMVFDFGGGTLDVSVIDVDDEKFQVKGIEGDSFLGGRDFDKKLLNRYFREAEDQISSKGDKRVHEHLLRLKKTCIKLKILLSVRNEATMTLDHFGRNVNEEFTVTVTRQEFEELCEDLFKRARDLVTKCLDDLGLTKNDIDELLLVGGSTRIPKVVEILKEYFAGKTIKTNLNPDEAVALGAAIQAAILENNHKELEKYKISDIAPLSLGFKVDGGLMYVAIQKNSVLPTKSPVIKTYTTINNQERCTKKIFEGERKNCKYNVLLATVTIDNLPKGQAGAVSFETVFSLDADGILEVEFTEISKNDRNKIIITTQEHRISQRKIKSTLEEAQKYREEDDLFEKLSEYRKKSRQCCFTILYNLHKIPDEKQKNTVEEKCNEFLRYVKDIDDKVIEDLQKKFKALKKEVEPIVKNKINVNFLDL